MRKEITLPLDLIQGPTMGGGSGTSTVNADGLEAALIEIFGEKEGKEMLPAVIQMVTRAIQEQEASPPGEGLPGEVIGTGTLRM